MYDVLIVGAGPAGSFLAHRLAGQGHSVAVVERQPEVGHEVCCTGIIGKECFEQFPIFQGTVLNQSSSASFFAPSGRSLRMAKDTPQAYVIDRAAFDLSLALRAQEAGADYILQAEVRDITKNSHCVRAALDFRGESIGIDARLAVICSGFGSRLPQKLGLGQHGDFVLGAEVGVKLLADAEVEVYFGQETAPGFFAWLVPTSPGRALVGLLCRRTPGIYLKKLLSTLVQQGKIEMPQSPIRHGGIPLKPLPHTHRERIMVVGDAAGQVKPTTGGGIYYGLLCADIAAGIIDRALAEDDFSDGRLGAYEAIWRKRLGRELQVGYFARRLYERLDDREIEELFDIVKSNGIHESVLDSHGFSFDWHGEIILNALKHKPMRKALWVVTKSLLPF